MSVFLNSTPQVDGNALTLGATLHGTTDESSVVAYRHLDRYLSLGSGGQFVGIWADDGTYLETGDTGFAFRWKFWARGSGTVALTQDTDPSWSTSSLPSTSIGNLVVGDGTWTLYNVAAGSIVLADFLSSDAIRLGLSLTSGTVDIETIQLECVPDTGTTGWWVNQPSYGGGPFTATAYGAGANTIAIENAPTRQDAWDAAYIAASATSPVADTDPTSLGLDNLGTNVTASASSWCRVNDVISPPDTFDATNLFGIYKSWVSAAHGSPTPDGDEGVDYIRIPGYTELDDDAYVASAANRDNPGTSFVNWDTPYAVYGRSLSFALGADYALTNMRVWFSIVEEEPHANTAPIDWSDRGSPLKTLTPSSPGTEVESVTLPSSGTFAIYAFASALDGDGGTVPVLPDPDSNVGVGLDTSIALQSTSDPDADPNLTYTVTYEAYSVWDPFATPPGGKLKVRLPDSTWRIVGDETGSDTERLKLQTPDLTWWKEYRASDGAVATHPLKLYTADGWIVASMMTPE